MCRGFLGCIIVVVNMFYMLLGIAMALIGALLLWNDSAQQKATKFLVEQLPGSKDNEDMVVETAKQMWATLVPASYALVAIGVCIIVLSIVAFIGVCCHVTCMLGTYVFIAGILALVELVVVIIYFADKQIFLKALDEKVEILQLNYVSYENGDWMSRLAAVLMLGGSCCGYNNGSDFKRPESKFSRRDNVDGKQYTGLEYPVFCCKSNATSECPSTFDNSTSNIDIGCKHALDESATKFLDLIMYGLVGQLCVTIIICLMVIGVIILRKRSKAMKV